VDSAPLLFAFPSASDGGWPTAETNTGSHRCPSVSSLRHLPLPLQCSRQPRHLIGLWAARKRRNSLELINFTEFMHPHEPAAFSSLTHCNPSYVNEEKIINVVSNLP